MKRSLLFEVKIRVVAACISVPLACYDFFFCCDNELAYPPKAEKRPRRSFCFLPKYFPNRYYLPAALNDSPSIHFP
jgi:hypothetical protein